MKNYQLELRQIVDFPRCRIYREFVQDLLADRSIRTGGCSGLFYYVVLCSYANFRTSYRRIDGISYTVYPVSYTHLVNEPLADEGAHAAGECHQRGKEGLKIAGKFRLVGHKN